MINFVSYNHKFALMHIFFFYSVNNLESLQQTFKNIYFLSLSKEKQPKF